jgi:retinol dehydrogenase-12
MIMKQRYNATIPVSAPKTFPSIAMSFIKNFLRPYPSPPSFTASSLIDLSSKVYIVTNIFAPANISLAKILYDLHATVYAGISSSTSYESIANRIRASCPDSKGLLKPFLFDPKDPRTIKQAVNTFQQSEWRLDVLFLDTISCDITPAFVLVRLLLPIMATTASHFCHPNPSIRVVWISNTNTTHIDNDNDTTLNRADQIYLLAHEIANGKVEQVDNARAHTMPTGNPSGVQHVLVDQYIAGSGIERFMCRLKPNSARYEEYEACMLLYAGMAPNVRSGDWVISYGRKSTVPHHVLRCVDTSDTEGKSASGRLCKRYEEQAGSYILAGNGVKVNEEQH